MNQKCAVVMVHNFDPSAGCVIFDDYEKAKTYLHWSWENYYNTELAEAGPYPVCALVEDECYHEDDYARVEWADGCMTEFILIPINEPEEAFQKSNWKRYI